jgi:hypothetical protein
MLTKINNNRNNNSYNNNSNSYNNNSYNNNSYNNSLLFRVFYNLCCISSPKEEEK